MQEAWRTYLELATGLGETSRKRVRKVVKEVVGKGNATADQVRSMTTDLLAANSANREALAKLVKVEVDRALGRVGLATMDEVSELTNRVHDLERQLKDAKAGGGTAGTRRSATASATEATAKKTTAKATTAKATAAKANTAKPTKATKATTAKAATAKATTAKATKAPAKKASARKAQP